MDLSDQADELFVLPPGDFVERRDALALAARRDGDTALADAIRSLRRPTVGAALINALVRERTELAEEFLGLGPKLRSAQDRGDGNELRALMRSRQQLMSALDRQVAELAKERGLTATPAVQRDVHTTMLTALADGRAEELVRAARLQAAVTDGSFDSDQPAAPAQPLARRTKTDQRPSPSAQRVAAAERKLKEATAKAVEADRAVQRYSTAQEQADAELAAVDSQLEEARQQVRQAERAKADAARRVASARDALADAQQRARSLRAAAEQTQSAYERESAN
jgi:hypothetical protein